MAQEIINYGNTANDGTGDPLRDAFIKVDENFNQIWAAGPVGSNITIQNNTVAVVNTNGNLILTPNGVGVIQTNSKLVPRLDNTYDLGSSTLRYRSLFVGAGGIDTSGNLTLDNISDLKIPGGTNGYVIQTDGAGNLNWTAMSGSGNGNPGGANSQVQYNNSGLFDGSTAFTFNDVSNVLTVVGNISGNYILGNGSALTGIEPGGVIQGNVPPPNPTDTTLWWDDVTGRLYVWYNDGSGSQWVDAAPAGPTPTTTYGNSNVVSLLAAFGSNTISTTGNITGNIVGPAGLAGNGQVVFNKNGLLGVSDYDFNFDQSTYTLYVVRGSFSGDNGTGQDALYAGIAGATYLGSAVMAQFTGNVDNYSQVNFQNINPGTLASGDYIITADNGTDSTYYLDMGIASSNHADPDFFGDTSTNNDAYIYVVASDQAGPSLAGGPGNLILGSTNGAIKMFVGNTAQANVVATVSSDGMLLNGNITGNTAGYAIGYRDIPQIALGANTTAALTDAGKHFYSTTAGNLQVIIPDNANVSFPTGATLTIVTNAAGNVIVGQGTGVTLYMAGSSSTGNRTVGAYGLASVMKVATNTWVISGTGVY